MSKSPEGHAVILAGGRGTRFWPLSRREQPKQLLDLTGDGSLLALTLERLEPLVPAANQWILTSEVLADKVREQARRVPPEQIIAEPVGRNTACAVGLAAALVQQRAGDVPFAVLPSDHIIAPATEFQDALSRAFEITRNHEVLLTFGVNPTRPETGYGYIEQGEPLAAAAPARWVAAFTEKPDLATAKRYLEGGRHFWNSGIFAWRPSVVLDGLNRELPELSASVQSCAAAGEVGTSEFFEALKSTYEDAPSISIDYALMEKAENVVVLPAAFTWNDVGQWVSMRDLWPLDKDGNCSRGEVLALSSRDCVVYGPERLTALLGVENIIVVQTEDATLVCDAKRSQDVRLVLEALQREGREDLQ